MCVYNLIIPAGHKQTSRLEQIDGRHQQHSVFNVPLKEKKNPGELCGLVPKMCYWRAHYGSPREQIHISSSRSEKATGMEAEDWQVRIIYKFRDYCRWKGDITNVSGDCVDVGPQEPHGRIM